jgi:hypothetical protein
LPQGTFPLFILAEERDEDAAAAFKKYRKYLMSVGDRFPPNAFELATSDWWFNFNDHKCPHDAWLEEAVIDEPSTGERYEIRHTGLRLTLLGAYHDLRIMITYKGVIGLSIDASGLNEGHGDWRYDEFRMTDEGLLVHEIEWSRHTTHSTWIITAEDIEYRSEPVSKT